MDQMDLISCNFDDGYINFADQIILAAETSKKGHLHLVELMKADNCEDFINSMGK